LSLSSIRTNFVIHMQHAYYADFAFTGPAARVEGTRN
jgi:hypothetical protein